MMLLRRSQSNIRLRKILFGVRRNQVTKELGTEFSTTLSVICKKVKKLSYGLRASSASPATGYAALHMERQKAVLNAALGL